MLGYERKLSPIQFEVYLHQGYEYYLDILCATIGDQISKTLYFSIARHINCYCDNAMGLDLEFWYLVQTTANDIQLLKEKVKDRFGLRGEEGNLLLSQFQNSPTVYCLELTKQEFMKRLKMVNVVLLEEHSRGIWRDILLLPSCFNLKLKDLAIAEPICPSVGYELGKRILQFYRHLPRDELFTKHYTLPLTIEPN